MPYNVNNAHVVDHLRLITAAETDDVFDGVTYWTNQQLYDVLNRHAYTAYGVGLTYIGEYSDKHIYSIPVPKHVFYEYEFEVEDNGAAVTYALSADNDRYLETDSELDEPLITKLIVYDLNGAAAEVWGIKAQQRADYVDWRAGSHNVRASQEYQHCLERQKYYRYRKARRFALRS